MIGLVLIVVGSLVVIVGTVLMATGKDGSGTSSTIIPAGVTMAPTELKSEALQLSSEILEFSMDREGNEPKQSDYGSFQEWTAALLAYSAESRNLFSQNFGGQLSHLTNELKAWNLSNGDFDSLCLNATNYIIIRNGAEALDELARRLVP